MMRKGTGKFKGCMIDDQTRNGVRVIVYRWKDGTTVDASCQCFGMPMRVHNNTHCPNLPKAT